MGKIRENLQRNLGYYLELNKISQKELSEKLGVSQSAVTNWIKGKNSPDIELVAAMCRIFDISITEMMGLSNKNTDLLKEKLLRNYDSMNKEGRDRLVTYSDDLIASGNYDAKTVRIKVQKSVARMQPGENYEDIPAVDEITGTIVTNEEDL